MPVFCHPEFDAHEKVLFGHDPETGLKAIIALHNTSRGPALGGCRLWAYESDEAALTDVLRLSRGMTYKSALADLPFGGGKSVIIGDAETMKSEALFRAMGRLVESLGGRYRVAEDVGVTVADVEAMGQVTRYVAGIPAGGAGDPSPATAWGVFCGLKASVRHKFGSDDLNGVSVAVQGLGAVGRHLAAHLHAAGAKLVVADINERAVRQAVEAWDALAVAPSEIHAVEAEIFAPCALGAVLNEKTIPQLNCAVIAGSANNQLATLRDGAALKARGILYAPDYVLNAGGIVNISHETQLSGASYDKATAFAHVARIGDTLAEIYRLAERADLPTSEAADRLAEQRFKPAVRQAA
ncbi:Leu/Phe/Val dehydrogenase [Algihabitans albus]|uniref:Leu/Phe/Val dehydrogenase n=1 Tax=Algihabitans albus TaxID=2164067 RepID=UPI000E5CA633|nr:Glu/Leu/Phe/Val dehydrogenase dimerization domain-containing protein [Algihabitans albus]